MAKAMLKNTDLVSNTENNDQQYRESSGGDSNMCIRDAMLAYVGPLQQDSIGSESTSEYRSESACVLTLVLESGDVLIYYRHPQPNLIYEGEDKQCCP